MSTVHDTDLLMVNRAGVEYKCTFADLRHSLLIHTDVNAVTLADVAGGARFTSVAFPVSATMTNDGFPPSVKKLKAYVEGALKSQAHTNAITSVGASLTPLLLPGSTSTVLEFNNISPVWAAGSSNLARRPKVTGDQTKMTFSFWFMVGRRERLETIQALISGGNRNDIDSTIRLTASGKLELSLDNHDGKSKPKLTTTAAFNAPDTWYHVVVAYDSTDATAADRWRLYVNGDRITAFDSPAYPELNQIWGAFNSGSAQMYIGYGPNTPFFDGYMSDIYWIDGQALDPTNFGEKVGGVWQPKTYAGTYGANGCHVDGKNPRNLGKNAAGSNDWTSPRGGPVKTVKIIQLQFADNSALDKIAAGDTVTEVGNGNDGVGLVYSVDIAAKTVDLSFVSGTWDVGSAVKGPVKLPAAGAKVRLYCKLDAAGVVSDLQSADPGFTAWTPAGAGPYTGTVTFPATLPSGIAPDTDLPAGTTITVEVEASNMNGSDSATSNTVTPA
jgi:hypothetical protein